MCNVQYRLHNIRNFAICVIEFCISPSFLYIINYANEYMCAVISLGKEEIYKERGRERRKWRSLNIESKFCKFYSRVGCDF